MAPPVQQLLCLDATTSQASRGPRLLQVHGGAFRASYTVIFSQSAPPRLCPSEQIVQLFASQLVVFSASVRGALADTCRPPVGDVQWSQQVHSHMQGAPSRSCRPSVQPPVHSAQLPAAAARSAWPACSPVMCKLVGGRCRHACLANAVHRKRDPGAASSALCSANHLQMQPALCTALACVWLTKVNPRRMQVCAAAQQCSAGRGG